MKTEITSAARKIARTHNARVRTGFSGNGQLVFSSDGSGGAWYSSHCYGFGSDVIVVSMRQGKMSLADAQAIIDDWAEK